MARIDIRDYFSKYAFDDGDDEEIVNYARSLANAVLQLLNVEFEERRLKYRVILNEAVTAHNPVRMHIGWETPEDGKRTWDCEGVRRKVSADFLRPGYEAWAVFDTCCPPEVDHVLTAVQQKIERMDDVDLR